MRREGGEKLADGETNDGTLPCTSDTVPSHERPSLSISTPLDAYV